MLVRLPARTRRDRAGTRRAQLIAIAVIGASAGACSTESPLVCLSYASASISVVVTDSASGVMDAAGATMVQRASDYVDSLVVPAGAPHPFPLAVSSAFERAGVYDVTITHPDFEVWERRGVHVRQGRCHVRQVVLEARMVRRAPAGSASARPQLRHALERHEVIE